MPDIIERFAETTRRVNNKYRSQIGTRHTDTLGRIWQIQGFNDLGVCYVSKVIGGKPQKKQYVSTDHNVKP